MKHERKSSTVVTYLPQGSETFGQHVTALLLWRTPEIGFIQAITNKSAAAHKREAARTTVCKALCIHRQLEMSPSTKHWKSQDISHRRKCKNLLSLHIAICVTYFLRHSRKIFFNYPQKSLDWKFNAASQFWKLVLNPFIKSTKLQITELGELIYLMFRISKLRLYHQALTQCVAQSHFR